MPTPLHVSLVVPFPVAEIVQRLPGGTFERAIDAPAALSAFVSSPLRVVERRTWDGDVAHMRFDVSGEPVSVEGELRLTPDQQGTLLQFDGNVTANVPFIGGMVEAAVRDEVSAQILREFAALSD